jgi:hypothetical protein
MFENKIHEGPVTKEGGAPNVDALLDYRLMHTGYSGALMVQKILRNIQYLLAWQTELTDKDKLFVNHIYLMREYMSLGENAKACEHCRYQLDNYERFGPLCKISPTGYLDRLYAIVELALLCPDAFDSRELFEKVFMTIKKNYPDTKDAALAELYYALLFDYKEAAFLKKTEKYHQRAQKLQPVLLWKTGYIEAEICKKAAFACHKRGKDKQALAYALTAMREAIDPGAEMIRMALELAEKTSKEEIITFLDANVNFTFDGVMTQAVEALALKKYKDAYLHYLDLLVNNNRAKVPASLYWLLMNGKAEQSVQAALAMPEEFLQDTKDHLLLTAVITDNHSIFENHQALLSEYADILNAYFAKSSLEDVTRRDELVFEKFYPLVELAADEKTAERFRAVFTMNSLI